MAEGITMVHYLGEVLTDNPQDSEPEARRLAEEMAPAIKAVHGSIDVGRGSGGNAVLLVVLPENLVPLNDKYVLFKRVRAVRVPAVEDQGIQ